MAKFISKSPNQVLTMVPNRKTVQDGIVIPVPGKHIEFNKGEYSTTDKQELAFIRGHRLFGVAIVEADEVGVK